MLVKNCNKCLYCALFRDQFDKNNEGFDTCTPKEYCPLINVYLFVDTIIAQACVDSRWIDHPYSLPLFQGSLNVNEAADPSSRACYLSRFLFSSDIMYEIIVFGLNDSNPKVSDWLCSGIANIIC